MPTKAETHQPPKGKADTRDHERLRRQNRGPRYYDTARWKRLRAMVLAREPLCVSCLASGRTVTATCVDHILPLNKGGTNHEGNLQGLCAGCHSKKTATNDGGFGR